jgi:hypothetical protein
MCCERPRHPAPLGGANVRDETTGPAHDPQRLDAVDGQRGMARPEPGVRNVQESRGEAERPRRIDERAGVRCRAATEARVRSDDGEVAHRPSASS